MEISQIRCEAEFKFVSFEVPFTKKDGTEGKRKVFKPVGVWFRLYDGFKLQTVSGKTVETGETIYKLSTSQRNVTVKSLYDGKTNTEKTPNLRPWKILRAPMPKTDRRGLVMEDNRGNPIFIPNKDEGPYPENEMNVNLIREVFAPALKRAIEEANNQ